MFDDLTQSVVNLRSVYFLHPPSVPVSPLKAACFVPVITLNALFCSYSNFTMLFMLALLISTSLNLDSPLLYMAEEGHFFL